MRHIEYGELWHFLKRYGLGQSKVDLMFGRGNCIGVCNAQFSHLKKKSEKCIRVIELLDTKELLHVCRTQIFFRENLESHSFLYLKNLHSFYEWLRTLKSFMCKWSIIAIESRLSKRDQNVINARWDWAKKLQVILPKIF